MQMKNKRAVMPQRKPNKVLSNQEFEQKILEKYNKVNPQPKDIKERVQVELNKLNKK